MASCEGAGLDRLFKLRLTKGARRLASRSMARDEGGFTTQDLKRCRHMARLIALVYNWWSLFVRLADPDRHREAITGFFQTPVRSAEQLSAEERWRRILAQALKKYLRGRQPGRQPWLPPPRAAHRQAEIDPEKGPSSAAERALAHLQPPDLGSNTYRADRRGTYLPPYRLAYLGAR